MFETLGKLNLSNPSNLSNLSNPLLNWRGIGLEPRGLLRPLRGSGFALGQPDDFVAGASQHSRPKWFYRAEASMMRRRVSRPVSWDAVRRFVQLSKIKAPCGATLAGLAWDVAANSVPLERWRPHVPSITVGKNRGVGNEKPPPNPLDNVFTQCFQGQKIFSLFSACS